MSARWKHGYNPDNIFVSAELFQQTTKIVETSIPRTQHRPITCKITAVITPQKVPFKRRFNFKKANWENFRNELDLAVKNLNPQVDQYEEFTKLVQKISRKNIPRGCRTNSVRGLRDESKKLMKQYEELFNNDPFSDETIEAGEFLLASITKSKQETWQNLMEKIDMKRSSRKAWSLVKSFSNDPSIPQTQKFPVTANQIAHQLLLNGK